MHRRYFVKQAGAGFLGLYAGTKYSITETPYRAVLFDGLAIFNTASITTISNELFSGNVADFISVWRSKQFEYCWLRETADKYVDFYQVTKEALHFSASKAGFPISPGDEQRLMNGFSELRAWDDVKPALEVLKNKGVRLGILSNFTRSMLDSCIRYSGLDGLFSDVISTDEAKSYKPSPKSYQLGLSRTGISRNEILFVAFAGWDVAGAKWFGYPVYWLNRSGAKPEGFGDRENHSGPGMSGVLAYF